MAFKLKSDYKPTGDQPLAIEKLVRGIKENKEHQVLLGVTGSGKTFTFANVIQQTQLPTLVISHNKTLAAQLYQELKEYFPENAVSYFVSYYDYYQPEAYIPRTDTYIEKEADINDEIDRLRLRATTNILTRPDAIVVASVSCIYNIGSPKEYGSFVFELAVGQEINQKDMFKRLTELQYERGEFGFHRGTFRVRGDIIDIYPAYEDMAYRIETEGQRVTKIAEIDPLDAKNIKEIEAIMLYPAKHYMTDPSTYSDVFKQIRNDLDKEVKSFKKQGKELEANRLQRKVSYDLEMIQEVGFVNGIENYSRYFDGRKPGEAPHSLLDYFHEAYGDKFLVIIDESHMTIPQVRGMYNGDQSRKQTLIDFGFRLQAAIDNRPLRFDEFSRRVPRFLYTSATPAPWELSMAGEDGVVEQLVRPTGIPDPEIEIRPTKGQIPDLMAEIEKRTAKGQRTLVTTLTKRMAEDLTNYLAEKQIKVQYLHSEVLTLDRSDILDDLRLGKYDVLVGINLLREGLDLPEVSLVAILDADKEGFLRSETALVQTMGRAARHIEGKVIMYADNKTGSMERAIKEVDRRRALQVEYNKENNITPETIMKPIRDKLVNREEKIEEPIFYGIERKVLDNLEDLDPEDMTPRDRQKLRAKLKSAMTASARDLNFELAAKFRDRIREIETL
ncbi:MAG: excinuclease ABC subunit UvrB [bacterium]|nr:excinuclease ABC subunit UvrB [bacterium]